MRALAGATIRVDSEWGRLERVVVNDGGALVDSAQARVYEQRYGSNTHLEAKHHPEGGPWRAEVARRQHAAFLEAMEENGVRLERVESVPGAIYGMFTRDVGFVVGGTLFLASLGDGVRQRELAALEHVAAAHKDVVHLRDGVVEGGDVFVHGRRVFVGLTKHSTNRAGFHGFSRHLKERGYEAVPVRCRENVLHLDCRFSIVGPDVALIHEPDIAPDDVALLRQSFRLLEAPREEMLTLAPNLVMLDESTAFVDARNTRTMKVLRSEGIESVPVTYSEVTKMWGAFHCTAFPLRRGGAG